LFTLHEVIALPVLLELHKELTSQFLWEHAVNLFQELVGQIIFL
jgi:hypothetical protein